MKLLLCLFLCVCAFQMTLVNSGAITDRIKSTYSNVKQSVKCGLHQAKSLLIEHEHDEDPCQKSQSNNKVGDDNGNGKSITPVVDLPNEEIITEAGFGRSGRE